MATSARAQELAEQLLGLESSRVPLPAERMRFSGPRMDRFKAMVSGNKKMIVIAAVVAVGAIAVIAGVSAYEKKKAATA